VTTPTAIPMIDPVIDVAQLGFTYPTGDEPALKDITLRIAPGEFLGIVGPSGAGKSTLCLCLKGLVPHSVTGTVEGDVTVLGENVIDDPPGDIAARVGLVFQDPEAQIIGLTVLEDLAFGPENFERDVDEIRELGSQLLEEVGLGGMEDRNTIELSGGQKQRLAIASALMLQPDILILDEPTSELDPVGKSDVFKIVSRLQDMHDVTVIMVEHETERLASMADRLVMMDHGRIVASGSPDELLEDVELFQRTGGERPPAAAELLWRLRRRGVFDGEHTLDPNRAVELVAARLGGTA
jgi:energy-coupling factor transport system ATP-binding protein